jgi:hypothetical protein
LTRYIYKPNPVAQRRVRVYKDTVRINKGIDPAKFTIEFPLGCEVWDDFRKVKYTIGKGDSDVER